MPKIMGCFVVATAAAAAVYFIIIAVGAVLIRLTVQTHWHIRSEHMSFGILPIA